MTLSDAFREDLAWQADRALELGRSLCTCEGRYHWSYGVLRAAGVTGGLRTEEPALTALVAPLIRDNARVMIGGSADLGHFCFVGRCAAARRPQITVIDRCKAPLTLIEEFAAIRKIECRTLQGDLLDLDGREQWDTILLHYTTEFFETASHPQLFNAIAASLAPAGTLVCVSMTGHKFPHEKLPDLQSAFRSLSLSALRRSSMAAHEHDPEFERLLDDYARTCAARRLNYPDADALHAIFARAGLRIVSEQVMPRRWQSWKVDPAAEFDRKTLLIATRDA